MKGRSVVLPVGTLRFRLGANVSGHRIDRFDGDGFRLHRCARCSWFSWRSVGRPA